MKTNASITVISGLLMGMFAQGALAAVDGTITFTGKVTDAPCTVSTSNLNQTVILGQIKTADVTGADRADLKHKTPFQINLQNCSPTLSDGTTSWNKMAVTFTDNADASNTTSVLNNSGSARGVSVGLQNQNGTDITLGTASADINAATSLTSQVLPFYAHFVKVGTEAGTPGTVEAKSDFVVSYK